MSDVDEQRESTKKPGGVTGKGFVKGDPRINRKGRPKSFDALRALAQAIAHEAALVDGAPLVIAGHVVTVAEAIMRKWAQSKDARLQQAFIKVAFGEDVQRFSVDLGQLTDEQLERIARGEDAGRVAAAGARGTRTAPAPDAPQHDGDGLG